MGIEVFKKHLREKRAIKVIAGIDNYNKDHVAKIARSAQAGRASALDIAADKEIYNIARKNTKLPIFVSSIHPFEILDATKWGADAVEIGNFNAQYKNKKFFTMDEIYDITLESLALIEKYDVFTCVTIPGTLDIFEQIKLTRKLEILGVDLIQTEGLQLAGSDKKLVVSDAQASIDTAIELAKNTTIPIMVSSAMDIKTVPMAFDAGAVAVGVGSAINKLSSESAMTTEIMNIVGSIAHRNSINREIVRTTRELSRY